MEEAGRHFERGRSPEMRKAFKNLFDAAMARVSREGVTREEVRKITDVVRAATKAIEEL